MVFIMLTRLKPFRAMSRQSCALKVMNFAPIWQPSV